MHHCERIYRSAKDQSNSEYIHKYNGSYIYKPLVDQQPISANNQMVRHVFKAKTFKSENDKDSKEGLYGTAKLYSLKKCSKQMKMLVRRHYRIDIKQYLVRKFHKPAYLLPMEAFEALRQVIPSKDNPSQLFKTQTMYFFKPYYFLNNLRHILNSEPRALLKELIPILSRSILSCCLKHGGLDNFIMTSSNLYMEDGFDEFAINYTSFVGLGLINIENDTENVLIKQFYEIFPHLTKQIMEKGIELKKQNSDVAIYSKIRSAIINILCIFIRSDIYFSLQSSSSTVTRKMAIQNTEMLSNRFDERIKDEDKTIKSIVKYFVTDYRQKKEKQRMQQAAKQKKTKQHAATLNQIQKKQVKQRQQNLIELITDVLVKEKKEIYWPDVIRVFTDIKPRKVSQADAVDIDKAFQELHQYEWENQQNQQFYLLRGLQNKKLYLPIKLDCDLKLVLAHENWWQIFEQTDYNFLHDAFSYKLLQLLLNKYESTNEDIRIDKAYTQIMTYMNKSEFNSKLKNFVSVPQAQKEKRVLNDIKKTENP